MQTTHWIQNSKFAILKTQEVTMENKNLAEQNLVAALKLGIITWFEYFDLYRKLEE